MTPLPSDFARSFLRCFAVQASWNHRTQIAGGLCYAMLPLLRRIHGGDPEGLREALARHLEPFNAHPYLAPLAVGALARLEATGADPERIEGSRRALSAPLGAAGDRLVWSGWRPFCLLIALAAYSLGFAVGASVLLFLILYNVGHVALRAWAFRAGWSEGPKAVQRLAGPVADRAGRLLVGATALLAGGVGVLVAVRVLGASAATHAVAASAAAVVALGVWTRPEIAGRLAPWIGLLGLVLLHGSA